MHSSKVERLAGWFFGVVGAVLAVVIVVWVVGLIGICRDSVLPRPMFGEPKAFTCDDRRQTLQKDGIDWVCRCP